MSADPTTPGADDGSSPPGKKGAVKTAEMPTFNDRDHKLLSIAMAHCLKSAPPDIDYQKFMKHGDFNTLKTAQNTWGKLKSKLVAAADAVANAGDGEVQVTPKPAKSAKTDKPTPKSTGKRGRKVDNAIDGEQNDSDVEGDAKIDEKPTKKPKTTPKTKKTIKTEGSE